MNKYSFLMSVYINDQTDWFEKAVESMRNQTLPPAEIVLVLDGPVKPEISALIDGYKRQYDYFKIVALEKNVGISRALNAGLEVCANEFVARMDADDISEPFRMKMQMDFLTKYPKIDVLGTYIEEFVNSEKNVYGVRKTPLHHSEIAEYAKSRNPMNHVSIVFKKSALLKVGSYPQADGFEDYVLWVNLLKHNFVFANIPEVTVKVRAGKMMSARRGGLRYLKKEIGIQRHFWETGFIPLNRLVSNTTIRIVARCLPSKLRFYFYKNVLRD